MSETPMTPHMANASPVDADRAKAPWGRGEDGRPRLPMGAHWTDIPELVDRTLDGIQARVDQAQPGHWYVAPATETRRAPGTVCTRVDGYPRTVGQFMNVLPADLELVLHAHDDLRWCLEMIAKLRAQGAEQWRQGYEAAIEVMRQEKLPMSVGLLEAQRELDEVDGITRRIAPVQALREDDDPARCLEVHPFSPRDGWRLICGSCDHGKDAACHRVEAGGAR